jgi:LysR family glycine cleavage system transcriptional activator
LANTHPRLPLNSLRTFEAAARHLSFKDAAEELFVSPTTVSNQIRELERDWGCPLFIRRTRAVVLTDVGRSLAAVLGQAFSDIRAEIDTHIAPTSKSVKLAVGPIFGSRWLLPRLEKFRETHPGIELVLTHSPRITSVESLSSQIAVDWGTGEWHGLDVTALFALVYSPVVSPELASKYGGLRHPADLSRFPIIQQRDRSEWVSWLSLVGLKELTFENQITMIDSNLVVQAAIAGQGVALGSFPFLRDDVATGRLVKPFKQDLHPQRSYFMLTRPGGRRNPEVDAVCQWLVQESEIT